jgi:molybdate-binding protein
MQIKFDGEYYDNMHIAFTQNENIVSIILEKEKADFTTLSNEEYDIILVDEENKKEEVLFTVSKNNIVKTSFGNYTKIYIYKEL